MSKIAPMVLLVVLLFPLSFSEAAGLVPCSGAPGDECDACELVQLVSNVINDFFVPVLSVIFAIMIVVSGLKLVTSAGNVTAKEEAKKRVMNGLIGFLIVLGAWLLMDYGLKALLDGGDGEIQEGGRSFGPWNEIQCISQPRAS